jgi:hypothetical protein
MLSVMTVSPVVVMTVSPVVDMTGRYTMDDLENHYDTWM